MYPQKAWEICQPIGNQPEFLYPIDDWFDCKNIGKLRLNIYSNIEVEVNMIWSFNKRRKCLITSNVATNSFNSIIVECLMRFFKIQILNSTGVKQTDLVVDIRLIGDTTKHVTINEVGMSSILVNTLRLNKQRPEKERITILDKITDSPESSQKNDKSSKRHRKFYTLKQSLKKKNDIDEDCLLVGGDDNKLKMLPKGNPGDILVIDKNGIPDWKSLVSDDISNKDDDG